MKLVPGSKNIKEYLPPRKVNRSMEASADKDKTSSRCKALDVKETNKQT